MKNWVITFLSVWLFVACGDVVLPEEEQQEGTKKSDTIVVTVGDTLSVQEALRAECDGEGVYVRGYIVGYIQGTSLKSNATFGVPPAAPNSNMLLADSPLETDYVNCLPVRLETNGDDFRALLNLYDHPEYYKQRVLISGALETYFKVNGLKTIWSVSFITAETTETDSLDFSRVGLSIVETPEIFEGR